MTPEFHADPTAEYPFSVENYHHRLEATRALVRELGNQLKLSGRYWGSKIELMHRYGVKISVLSVDSLIVELPKLERFPQVANSSRRSQQLVSVPPAVQSRDEHVLAPRIVSSVSRSPVLTRRERVARQSKRPARQPEEGYDD